MAMKSVFAAAIVLTSAMSSATDAEAQGTGNQFQSCTARVVYSEETPFAPVDNWHVNVTLAITPQNGSPYVTALETRMPWQGPPPRRGQVFRVWCDPAHPGDLRLANRPVASSF
jgi:hypothetical protein